MQRRIKLFIQVLFVGVVALSFQACSLKIPLKSTVESENKFEPKTKVGEVKKVTFENLLDKESKIVTGVLQEHIFLEHQNKPFDGYSFIKNAFKKEFKARSLPISIVDTSDKSINLEKFEIFVHRVNAFTPLVTLSSINVTATIGEKKQTFTSVIKRGKVPVWEMSEVFDPCFNEPINLMVKEIVAKINKAYFDYKLSDANLSKLLVKIEDGISMNDKLNYLNIYELGFSNNEKALEFLRKYSNLIDEYIRLASISMLGFIGGEAEFDYLVSKYRTSKLWQDKAFALKAIADINTEKSRNFLKDEYNYLMTQSSKEARWNTMFLDILKVSEY